VLAVTFHLLHVGVITEIVALPASGSYRFYIDITDTKWSNTWYRIDSILILPIPSDQILGIVSILYLLVSPITMYNTHNACAWSWCCAGLQELRKSL